MTLCGDDSMWERRLYTISIDRDGSLCDRDGSDIGNSFRLGQLVLW